MLQKRNTPVLRFRNLIFKDVLGVLEDWGFDHIKCFTFITQILEGHKISLKIRITGSNGLTTLTYGWGAVVGLRGADVVLFVTYGCADNCAPA